MSTATRYNKANTLLSLAYKKTNRFPDASPGELKEGIESGSFAARIEQIERGERLEQLGTLRLMGMNTEERFYRLTVYNPEDIQISDEYIDQFLDDSEHPYTGYITKILKCDVEEGVYYIDAREYSKSRGIFQELSLLLV